MRAGKRGFSCAKKRGIAVEGRRRDTLPNSPYPHLAIPFSVLVRIEKFYCHGVLPSSKKGFDVFFGTSAQKELKVVVGKVYSTVCLGIGKLI